MDLENAKKRLLLGNCTCVLCKGNREKRFHTRGILPLLEALKENVYGGFSAADKVVGSGAAFLYCLLNVRAVYAPVMSTRAKALLENAGIFVCCDRLVPAIINRKGDGLCPMELATAACHTPEEALRAIEETIKNFS